MSDKILRVEIAKHDMENYNTINMWLLNYECEHEVGTYIKDHNPHGYIPKKANDGAYIFFGDQLIGGLTFYMHDEWLFLECGYVLPKYRNNGLYHKVLEIVENHAKENGYNGIFVSTYTWEAPAIYEAMGYTKGAVMPNCPTGNTSIDYYKILNK